MKFEGMVVDDDKIYNGLMRNIFFLLVSTGTEFKITTVREYSQDFLHRL